MPWQENLYLEGKGSFRGVEFYVEKADTTFGRRTVVHRYPLRATPHVEDMGRASFEPALVCYVLGDDYDTERDNLRAAFETPGPGLLIHPFQGEFTVAIDGLITISEQVTELGMARFSLRCVEVADESQFTVAAPDAEPEVNDKADAAKVAAADDFEEEFDLQGAINAARTAAVSAISDMAEDIRAARAIANTAINAVDDVASQIDELVALAETLIDLPGQLAQAVQDLMGSVMNALIVFSDDDAATIAAGGIATDPAFGGALYDDFRADQLLTVFDKLTLAGSDIAPVTDTGSGQSDIEANNQTQLQALYRNGAAIEGCRAFAALSFDSRDKVEEVRDFVAVRLDELIETANDQVWGTMTDLRAAITQRLDEVAGELPSIREITPNVIRSALVTAYDLYGDAERDIDIISLNNLENPCMIPGSIVLRVLADG